MNKAIDKVMYSNNQKIIKKNTKTKKQKQGLCEINTGMLFQIRYKYVRNDFLHSTVEKLVSN